MWPGRSDRPHRAQHLGEHRWLQPLVHLISGAPFEALNPNAVFTMATHTLDNPAEARICRYEGGTNWACVVPEVNLQGAS